MTVIPVTMLLHEGPIARAYLALLSHCGYRPARIILMLQDRDPASGRRITPWLWGNLRLGAIERLQNVRFNYWAREIAAKKPALFRVICETVSRAYGLPDSFYPRMVEPPRYSTYSENIKRVLVRDGLSDAALAAELAKDKSEVVLFTGGGIIPRSLFTIPHKKFIHIHPGYLPELRGADGLLWSTLVRGRPGVSAIYMNSGIDTGAIIRAEDCAPLAFSLPSEHFREPAVMLYRALFAFYDPVLRAQLLCKVVAGGNALEALPAKSQTVSDGIAYNFMHPVMRECALRRLFPNWRGPGEGL